MLESTASQIKQLCSTLSSLMKCDLAACDQITLPYSRIERSKKGPRPSRAPCEACDGRGNKNGAVQEYIRGVRAAVAEAVVVAMTERDAKIGSLEEELKEFKELLKVTREQLKGLEQYSRRLCLDISKISDGSGNFATNFKRASGSSRLAHDVTM